MKSLLLTAALASALALHARAQSAQAPPTFKAGVELVRLDIQVTDGDGQPVPDLKQDEVEVLEAGKPRPVIFFQHVEEPRETFDEAARQTVVGDVSTNQGAPRGHLYVLVFDQTHILPGHEQRARLAAQRFLRTKLRRGDRVAAYALPGPGVQTGFAADPLQVARALDSVRGLADEQQRGPSGTMTVQEAFQILRGEELTTRAVIERVRSATSSTDVSGRRGTEDSDQMYRAAVKEDASGIADQADAETRRMLRMLGDILRPMRAIEGRKTVLFFSEGFYGDRVQRDIEQLAAAAAESYSVIDAIDISQRPGDVTRDAPSMLDVTKNFADPLTPLGSLAAETDGQFIVAAAYRADEVLDQIARQSQDYYLVGFTPHDTGRSETGYHRVTVRVNRRGARVSARTGFALDEASAKLPRREALDRAIKAPFALQGLPIRYTTYTMRGSAPGQQRVIVSLAVDLPIAPTSGATGADVVFVVRSAEDGRVAASGTDVIPLPHSHDEGTTTGVGTYHVQFEAPAGDYLMRVAVREPGGLTGTADRRFTVRALDGPALTSGDLMLSGQRGELPVRPTTYTGDGLSGVVELYARTAEQLQPARVEVALTPVGEDTAVVTGSADLSDVRTIAGGVARTARIDLPLTGVPPGTYLAHARVKSGPDTVSDVVREVEVRSGRHPAVVDEADTTTFDPRAIAQGDLAREFSAKMSANGAVGVDAVDALKRLGAGDFAGAVAALNRTLDADPNDGTAAFFLGWAYHGAGDDRDAITAWRRAVYVDPTLVPAHLALADMYVRLSQPALAAQALNARLRALPNSPELQERLNRLEHR